MVHRCACYTFHFPAGNNLTSCFVLLSSISRGSTNWRRSRRHCASERAHARTARWPFVFVFDFPPTFSFVHESMEREIFGRMKGRTGARAHRLRGQGGQILSAGLRATEDCCFSILTKFSNSVTWQHCSRPPAAGDAHEECIPFLPPLWTDGGGETDCPL